MFVDQFVPRFGTPAQLHSNQGRNFKSQVFTEMCKLLGIEKTRTTPRQQQRLTPAKMTTLPEPNHISKASYVEKLKDSLNVAHNCARKPFPGNV